MKLGRGSLTRFSRYKKSVVLPGFVLLASLVGGLVGPRLEVHAATVDQQTSAAASENVTDTFSKIYSLVEENFATPVSPADAIYKGAIPGMLHELDPHSTFFAPKEYQALREEQNGRYSGVGMQVGPRGSKTVVLAPFPGFPAYRAGIRPGDTILSVNDRSADNLNTTEVADLLKGPPNTAVKIVVQREGAPEPITFNLTREDVTRPTVPVAFWIKPGIAYVKVLSFGDATSRELDAALKRLGEDDIDGLIFDLRDNPGGLLSQAVDVSGHFLERGQTVVSHRGRSSSERVYMAQRGSHGREYPIVILVNRYSASAAEIVSGALQDHDRAWVLGETTFGKGLVQTVFPLRDRTGLALTTAHFYTPSGRLIQRDYSRGSFYDYYFHRDPNARNENDVKMTDSGRTVYGGGGITPDEKYLAPRMDSFEVELYRNGLFSFTRSHFAKHTERLPQGWMPDNALLEELHDYLLDKGFKFTERQFTGDHDWIKRYLAREMYIWAFNVDDSDRVFAMTDPEVQRAVDALPRASALLENAKKVIVQRR